MSALSQFFLNPAFFLPGAALVLLPILIHILSRLRYRTVRFAAMEFLLASEELNRRRLILEQLLQLLLRILAVLLFVLLIAGVIPENIRPCTQGVPCSEKVIEWFGFVTIPLLAVVAFSIIIALLVLAHRRGSK